MGHRGVRRAGARSRAGKRQRGRVDAGSTTVRLPHILHQVLTELGLGNTNQFPLLIRWKMALERCSCACSTAKLETCCWPFTAGFMASWLTYQHYVAARGYLVATSHEQNMRIQRWVGEVIAALEPGSSNLQRGHTAVGLGGWFTTVLLCLGSTALGAPSAPHGTAELSDGCKARRGDLQISPKS